MMCLVNVSQFTVNIHKCHTPRHYTSGHRERDPNRSPNFTLAVETSVSVLVDAHSSPPAPPVPSVLTECIRSTAQEDGTPLKWRIENSWGEEYGDTGYMVMTHDWFLQFVFEVSACDHPELVACFTLSGEDWAFVS